MKTYIYLLIFMSSAINYSQNFGEDDKSYFYFELGAVKPLGLLNKYYDFGVDFKVWFRNQYINNNFVDLGINIIIPNKIELLIIDYPIENSTTYTKNLAGSIDIKFVKQISIRDTKSIEYFVIGGYGFYAYRRISDGQPRSCETNENEICSDIDGLSTIHLASGLTYRMNRFGVNIQYNFAPYQMFSKRINENIGNSYLNLSLVYHLKR